ncbi:luciferin 4-monooxygenase [Diachasma alloeum]|uniref:luciferin 4-monooxygenase n=1 Tax=Diachasma alloeum TaxID=454923 RepID=UPI0007383799|nr:luciferin 4-monooxygenase [Diachasma alloeum]
MENSNKEPVYDCGIWRGVVETQPEWHRYRSFLLERLGKFPDRIAQIDAVTNRKDTYRELSDRIVRCALWLKTQNLKPDDVIGICTYNHLDTFVPVLAIILTGYIMNPWWNAVLDYDLAKYFLNLTQPKIIFADDVTIGTIKQAVDEVGSTAKIIAFLETPGFESLAQILNSQSASEVAKFQPKDLTDMDEPFWIAYTSGTTGYPKGAVLSYKRIILDMNPIPEEPSINFWAPAICWTTGVCNMLATVIRCSTAVLCTGLTEEIIAQILEKHKVTRMLTSNTAIAARMSKIESIKKYDFSSVKIVMFGGVGMLPEVEEFLMDVFPNALVVNAYGSTEAGFICCRRKKIRKLTSCGQVAPHCEIKIVDPESGKILGPNEEGEMYVKIAGAMLRYYKDDQNTKAAFDEEGWFRTGDLAYYDEDGDIFIVDRLKELIKFRNNIHIIPGVIEGVILKHPGVFEVAVVAKPHPTDAEHPIAFVSKHPKATITEHEITELVAQNLPDHMALRGGVVFLDEMPHTDAGKIAKKELRRMARSGASGQ